MKTSKDKKVKRLILKQELLLRIAQFILVNLTAN